MSGSHQICICLLAALVASLSMVPLELQRRIVNGAIGDANFGLLISLGGVYLGVVLLQASLKYVLRLYQGWLTESAIRYCREHLSEIHECRSQQNQPDAGGKAVSIIGAELEKLGGFVGEGLSQPVVNLGIVVAVFGFMLVVEPLIALFSLPFLLPQLLVIAWVQQRINDLIEKRLAILREMGDTIALLPRECVDLKDTDLIGQLDS
ncbi:MAG: ABC transporter ATP-binding protein, partial [Kiloniellales bacterium]|nr:ABC transporter ATP-binding protein [Kiloniellales bacterium]